MLLQVVNGKKGAQELTVAQGWLCQELLQKVLIELSIRRERRVRIFPGRKR